MHTLRQLLDQHSWIAVTQGVSVEDACAAFERSGIDLDRTEAVRKWRRQAFSDDDLLKIVRARLVEALDGKTLWDASQDAAPGLTEYVAPWTLPSARADRDALVLRIVTRSRGDRQSIEQIAEAEGVTIAEVREILDAHGPLPQGPRRATPDQLATAELEAQLTRLEKLRSYFESNGRRLPGWLDDHRRTHRGWAG